MKKRGIFIALEGTDGAGKKTQKEFLVRRLKKDGRPVKEISFPQYDKPSAWQIAQYLNGFFGKPDKVNPYFASLLFADDRREARSKIEEWLKEGYAVIADRYVASNAGHQGGKIIDPRERKRYLQWLWKTEFEVNQIPRPDINMVLWVPPGIAQKNIAKKGKRGYLKKGHRRDGHERDLSHLKRAAASYRWLAKNDPRHFRLVECMKGRRLCSPEEIHERIWTIVKPILKKPPHHPESR